MSKIRLQEQPLQLNNVRYICPTQQIKGIKKMHEIFAYIVLDIGLLFEETYMIYYIFTL
jgi:hypothetical protein